MSDPAIIEAAARAIAKFTEMPDYWDENDSRSLALVMLAAVTPLIEAAALEKAAKVADVWTKTVAVPEKSFNPSTAMAIAAICTDTGQKIAAAIRALKPKTAPSVMEIPPGTT